MHTTNNEFTSKFLKLSEYNELLEKYLFHHLIQPDEPFDYKDNLDEINSNKFILLFDVKACKSCVLSQLIDIKDKYKLDPNNILLISNFEDSNDFLGFLVSNGLGQYKFLNLDFKNHKNISLDTESSGLIYYLVFANGKKSKEFSHINDMPELTSKYINYVSKYLK